jgi:diadenosine tetraphosphate (Ap4A) HIT family hydrolase
MCSIAARAERLAENEHAIAVLARFAVRRGHLLIVAREHVEAVERLSEREWLAMSRLAWQASVAAAKVLAPVRTYVAALGSVAPIATSFPHVHQHVVPLYDGGEADRPAEVFTWRHGVFVYEDGEAEALAGTLRAAWPSG